MHRFIHQWCEQASQNAVAMMLWPTRAGPGYPGNCGLFWSQESEDCECARRSVPPPSPRSFIFHFLSCLSLGCLSLAGRHAGNQVSWVGIYLKGRTFSFCIGRCLHLVHQDFCSAPRAGREPRKTPAKEQPLTLVSSGPFWKTAEEEK